jgi:hypothetical protein
MTANALFRRMAADLAERFGKDVTLRRTESEYDPGTGTTVETDYDVPARAAPPQDFTTDYIQDSLIQQGDTVVDVPAKGLDMTSSGASGSSAPQPSDKVVIDGTEWALVQVGAVYGGGDVAVYRLHARK